VRKLRKTVSLIVMRISIAAALLLTASLAAAQEIVTLATRDGDAIVPVSRTRATCGRRGAVRR
jgi:hypothetical protein